MRYSYKEIKSLLFLTRGRSPPAGETGRSCNEAGRVALSGGVALLGIGFFIDFAAKITGAMVQDKGVA